MKTSKGKAGIMEKGKPENLKRESWKHEKREGKQVNWKRERELDSLRKWET